MVEVKRAGLESEEVEWVVVADYRGEERQRGQVEAMSRRKTDATFVAGGTEKYEEAGFHVLKLDPLPMITGPTITTAINALGAKDRLGERMVKAMVMTVH